MALKFQCEKCGGEVVVKYLQPGEQAQCRHCGAYVTVPRNAVEAEEESELAKMRRYRATEKPADPFEGYRCPACGGTNLSEDFYSFWLGFSVPGVRQIVSCGDCGAAFKVKHPQAWKFGFFYMLFGLIILAFCIIVLRTS